MSDNTHLDMKAIFLALLQDPDIAATLQGICKKASDNPVQDTKETYDYKELRSEIREAQKEIKRLKDKNIELEKELKTVKEAKLKLSDSNKDLENQVRSLESFGSLDKVYSDYCTLPEELCSGYGNLICQKIH